MPGVKTNINNDDWYPGCERERDIIEEQGKVPRHVRFSLSLSLSLSLVAYTHM
eukprot:COSAG03_NODE_25773_length_263_cov_0.951220_1_plen_52_part_01